MLKTNSKQARQNIQQYILDNTDTSDFDGIEQPETFTDAARLILWDFRRTQWNSLNDRQYHKTEQNAFIYWCSGLPSILDTCYYCNRSAIADLGDILQETDEQRNRYSETDAENLLTKLIYAELIRTEQ